MDPHSYASQPQLSGLPPGTGRGAGGRWIAVFALLTLLFAAIGTALTAHNEMLGRAEAVDAAWAQVESNLQRRADLVPRLVETVDRYVRHESELMTDVTRERSGAARAVETALDELDRAQRASARQQAAGGASPAGDAARLETLARNEAALTRGVRAVLAVAESYPELRSADQFLELQAQLEGSENRINVARMAFNDAVRDYNAALVQLPTRWIAESRGLERRAYFSADEGARVAGPLAFE
jgi:LemA protein